MATAAIFCLHALGLVLLFSPLGGLVDRSWLIYQDWGPHFHHLSSLEAFWIQDRRVWGYDPSFMAGFPANTIQDLSIKLFAFLALGLSTIGLTPVQWFKLCVFLAMASVPWMMYFSARNFLFGRQNEPLSTLTAVLLGTLYWWSSLPREMFFYGMVGFAAASYASVLGVSLFYRLAAHPSASRWMVSGWLLFAVAIVPLHPQASVIVVPPVLVLLATQRHLMTARLLAWVGAAGLLSALVNAPWLLPALAHKENIVAASIVTELPIFATPHPLLFLLDYLSPEGYWTFRPSVLEKVFRLSLLLLGIYGTLALIRSRCHGLGLLLAAALVALFTLAYFGGLSAVFAPWQPMRFKVPLDLFLALGVSVAAGRWWAAPPAARSKLGPAILVTGLLACVTHLVLTEPTGQLRLRTGLPPHLEAIVDWISRETPAGARVLFEESGDETGFVYYGAYLSSFLPGRTGRELIGGPSNLYNDRHHFAGFHSGQLFKRDIRTLSDRELYAYLERYNIGAVVAFHPPSIERLLSVPGLVTLDRRIGPVYLMKAERIPSWFLSGEGRVEASFNRIELFEVTGQEVVLSYHWIDGLRAEPPVEIAPVRLGDDPIPFIRLIAPPSRLTLRVGSSIAEGRPRDGARSRARVLQ